MPEEDYSFTPASKLIQADEMEAMAKIFIGLGVNKIRLTGGEPLVRKDAPEIIQRLSALPVSLTMTTNGIRVDEMIDVLKSSTIRSLNISLDTLQKDRFQLMTKRDHFDRVFRNINLLLDEGFHVKVNVVVTRGLNDGEINDFVEWTREKPVHVRFIEFMPFTKNQWSSGKVFTWKEMLDLVSERFDVLRLQDDVHDTAKKYKVPGHEGTFAVISTMSAPFCAGCNRMRLTADGKMKNCLFSKTEYDLLTPFRMGRDIVPLIHESIHAKAEMLGGQFTADFEHIEADQINNRSMINIGG
jgi:cyclic pyranopterin phosphate synthase